MSNFEKLSTEKSENEYMLEFMDYYQRIMTYGNNDQEQAIYQSLFDQVQCKKITAKEAATKIRQLFESKNAR